MTEDRDIIYRPRGYIQSKRAGAHASRAIGSLGHFRDQVPFMAYPDARRIDVRATLRDPFENTFVRRFQQRVSIDLYALVDLTASLNYKGVSNKRDQLIAICSALARSATRLGDRFGLIGCDEGVREDCFITATKRRSIAAEVTHQLANAPMRGRNAEGLREASERLLGSRKMVFIISDFRLPLGLVQSMFEALAQHDIVPIVLCDSSEADGLPDWGFMELADLETGARHLVFMRPKLKQLWIEREKERLAAIAQLAMRFGRAPISIIDRFDADEFSRDLLES